MIAKFDWKDLLGDKLVNKTGETDPNEALEGCDAIGIYFSAHWCPPCKGFTPKLADAYNALKAAGKKFEVVFASSDKDEGAFADYHATMPWLAMPYSDRDRKNVLAKKYNVAGIPFLVILNADGTVITTDGRAKISAPSYILDYPFGPKIVNDVKDSMDGINDGVSLLLIQNYVDDDAVKNQNSAMFYKFAGENKDLFHKYFTVNGGGKEEFIRGECDLGEDVKEAVFICLDLPKNKYYKALSADISADAIKAIAADFKSGGLTAVSLKSGRK